MIVRYRTHSFEIDVIGGTERNDRKRINNEELRIKNLGSLFDKKFVIARGTARPALAGKQSYLLLFLTRSFYKETLR